MPDEFMTLSQARKQLNISKPTIGRLVQAGTLPTFINPLDKRQKLVKRSDVEKLLPGATTDKPYMLSYQKKLAETEQE